MNVPGDRTDSHFKAVPFPPHLPSKLDNSSVRLRLVAPGLLQRMLCCPNEACGLALPHKRGSPAFAFELCSRSLSGSYSPKFLQRFKFSFCLFERRRAAGALSRDILTQRRPLSAYKPHNLQLIDR